MPLTTQEWHNRYSQQAEWTRGLRNYLYTRVELGQGHRVLDVGCGTGILVAEMEERIQGDIFGLDLSLRNLSLAIGYAKHANFLQGDAHFLPYSNQIFDLSYCHFLLLWVTNPLKVVKEMARVTRPGGVVLALAEPDYGSRIDFPEPLPTLGQWQATSLEYQGADPRLGRRLSALFHQAGLVGVQTGVLGGEWGDEDRFKDWETEWKIIQDDLTYLPQKIPYEQVEELRQADFHARKKGERILFVPTFFAWGYRP